MNERAAKLARRFVYRTLLKLRRDSPELRREVMAQVRGAIDGVASASHRERAAVYRRPRRA